MCRSRKKGGIAPDWLSVLQPVMQASKASAEAAPGSTQGTSKEVIFNLLLNNSKSKLEIFIGPWWPAKT